MNKIWSIYYVYNTFLSQVSPIFLMILYYSRYKSRDQKSFGASKLTELLQLRKNESQKFTEVLFQPFLIYRESTASEYNKV